MKKHILLLAQPVSITITYFLLSFLSTVGILLTFILKWTATENIWRLFFYYSVLIPAAVIFLICGILHIEIAVIDEEKIVIRNIFKKIRSFEWSDCISVKIEKLPTFGSRRFTVCLNWIVIRKNENQTIAKARLNFFKSTAPVLLAANKKNLSAIKSFVSQDKLFF